MAEILLVDYGNREKKPATELFRVAKDKTAFVREQPKLAIPVALYGLSPVDWDNVKAIEEFREMATKKEGDELVSEWRIGQ